MKYSYPIQHKMFKHDYVHFKKGPHSEYQMLFTHGRKLKIYLKCRKKQLAKFDIDHKKYKYPVTIKDYTNFEKILDIFSNLPVKWSVILDSNLNLVFLFFTKKTAINFSVLSKLNEFSVL